MITCKVYLYALGIISGYTILLSANSRICGMHIHRGQHVRDLRLACAGSVARAWYPIETWSFTDDNVQNGADIPRSTPALHEKKADTMLSAGKDRMACEWL
jgi:hypothetical protein